MFRCQVEILALEFAIHEFGYFRHGLPNWNFVQSFTPLWRFYYTLENGHHIGFGEQKLALSPEHIVIVPGGCVLNLHSSRRVPQFYFLFLPKPAYSFRSGTTPFPIAIDGLLQHQIQQLIQLSENLPHQDTQRMMYHGMQSLLHACFQRHPIEPQILPQSLLHILDVIEAAPGSALHNDLLAHRAGLSTSAFIRWFESHMGVPPATYVRQVRLDSSCQLLTLTSLSIEEIATRSGFANRHYFTRAFTRYTGSAPAAFRKQFQAQRVPN